MIVMYIYPCGVSKPFFHDPHPPGIFQTLFLPIATPLQKFSTVDILHVYICAFTHKKKAFLLHPTHFRMHDEEEQLGMVGRQCHQVPILAGIRKRHMQTVLNNTGTCYILSGRNQRNGHKVRSTISIVYSTLKIKYVKSSYSQVADSAFSFTILFCFFPSVATLSMAFLDDKRTFTLQSKQVLLPLLWT